MMYGHHGRALKLLNKLAEDKPTKDIDNKSIEVSTCLFKCFYSFLHFIIMLLFTISVIHISGFLMLLICYLSEI